MTTTLHQLAVIVILAILNFTTIVTAKLTECDLQLEWAGVVIKVQTTVGETCCQALRGLDSRHVSKYLPRGTSENSKNAELSVDLGTLCDDDGNNNDVQCWSHVSHDLYDLINLLSGFMDDAENMSDLASEPLFMAFSKLTWTCPLEDGDDYNNFGLEGLLSESHDVINSIDSPNIHANSRMGFVSKFKNTQNHNNSNDNKIKSPKPVSESTNDPDAQEMVHAWSAIKISELPSMEEGTPRHGGSVSHHMTHGPAETNKDMLKSFKDIQNDLYQADYDQNEGYKMPFEQSSSVEFYEPKRPHLISSENILEIPVSPTDEETLVNDKPTEMEFVSILQAPRAFIQQAEIIKEPTTAFVTPDNPNFIKDPKPELIQGDDEHSDFAAPPSPFVNYNFQGPVSAAEFNANNMNVENFHELSKPEAYSSLSDNTVTDLSNPDCKVHLIKGLNLISGVEVIADGNYKLKLTIDATIPVVFKDLIVGKCGRHTPGIAILDEVSYSAAIEIDMAICQEECDLEAENNLKSSIDIMNQPIEVSFSLIEKRGDDQVLAVYQMFPKAHYYEDYIVDFDISSGGTSQLVVDNNGAPIENQGNLQFNFMTYTDNEYDRKTRSTKKVAAPGQTTFFEITPTNGFTPGKMITVPEVCFLKDMNTNEMIELWDVTNLDVCVPNMQYQTAYGRWQFELNLYESFGYAATRSPRQHSGQNNNNFVMTCSLRVCGAIAGNDCSKILDNCGYGIEYETEEELAMKGIKKSRKK